MIVLISILFLVNENMVHFLSLSEWRPINKNEKKNIFSQGMKRSLLYPQMME